MSTLSRLPAQGSPNQDKTGRILTETLIALTSVNVLAPSAAPTLTGSTTGGTLAAHAYFYVISAVNATGESAQSTEATVTTTGSTGSVGLTWPAVANATAYKVYRGTVTATENVYYLVPAPAAGITPSFTDIGATNTAGTPLSANTTIANLVPTDYFHLVTLALASPATLNFGLGSTVSLPYAGQSYATPPNVGDEIQCLFTNASGSSQTVTLGTGAAVTATTLVIANNKTGNITLTFNGAIWCETARSVTV
jgi:hypothetical protein